PAQRGTISDRNGIDLAVSEPAQDISATPYLIKDPLGAAQRLAPLLGVSQDDVLHKLSEHSGFVYLAHRVPDSVAAAVNRLALPGINLVPENQRVEPGGQLAQPVVGSVDYDGNGASGLEYQYQAQLAGQAGTKSLLESPGGVALPGGTSRDVAAKPGIGLELTLDESVQYVAEQALASEVLASHAASGTAIVMNVRTGDVLAMADLVATPAGASPAPAASSGTSGPVLVSAADTLPAGVAEAPSNSAVTQVYEPGSVFKLVTFSAALQGGIVNPDTSVKVPAELPMGTYTFHDAESHGDETLTPTQILAQSSNIGTIEIAQQLGESGLLGQITNLGFGRPTGLAFPGESPGLVPGASQWTGTSIGSTPIGQDDAVTAQQILDAYNAVANGGVFVSPRLVRGTVDPSGGVSPAPASRSHRVIAPGTAAELVPMLESVVASGTGTSAAIDGYTVAGKTGTAQIPAPDHLGYEPGAYVGSFCGFAPAQNPVLSAIVVLDHPTPIYGGAVAAPVFSTIMAYALHHYGIPTTSTPTTASSTGAIGGQGSVSVPAGATTEGP
ncbi:MAG: penicillin-binding protein 2, partial [Acidimicrobiales bacterium]|nr:penicillin-binding protein 2 [Acidimicrobiales bacterium]